MGDRGILDELFARASQGDRSALGELLDQHRDRLLLMVRMRLDQRLQARVDPSDVIQEAFLEAAERFEKYSGDPVMPFFLWLRFITSQKLLVLHRHHLGVQMRDAGRENSLYHGKIPEASSAALAAQLIGHQTTPSQVAIRAEMQAQLKQALERLDPLDREVISMRHFEQLSNREAAQLLDLSESTASQRYGQALLRLKEILADFQSI